MEYDFSSLNTSKIFNKEESSAIFLYFIELKKKYKLHMVVGLDGLFDVLIDDVYLVMNNHSRYKGKKIFFTGNAVESNKNDLLDFISKPVNKYDLIVPLFIVPVKDGNDPAYIITTQEDPTFYVYKVMTHECI